MLGAFALFLGLLFWRWQQERCENQQQQPLNLSKRRRIFKIVQLVVLLALLIYMIPGLWMDVQDFSQVVWSTFLLRCLIFVITIYTLGVKIQTLFRRKE